MLQSQEDLYWSLVQHLERSVVIYTTQLLFVPCEVIEICQMEFLVEFVEGINRI